MKVLRSINEFKTEFEHTIQGYTGDQIFNADETNFRIIRNLDIRNRVRPPLFRIIEVLLFIYV
jgi:hypothetical protein